MFSIFKKKSSPGAFPFERLKADMHSHLIPAVDDGSPSVEESLILIKGMLELGYEKLITSPHVMQDMYPNNPQSLGMGYDEIKRDWPDVPLTFAAEYFLDDHVLDLLAKDQKLLTIKDNMVLVEFSFISPPMGYKEMIFELQMKGYQPILAHPERYSYFHRQPREFDELKASGCLFQSNILSFSGYYGGSVKDAAEYLVNHNLVELLGTDLHHQRHLGHLRELPFTPALQKLIDRELLNSSL
ncbi:MAG TPA: CpsB/CapC family capsule biosynthesis tyrosine phosphatase [Chitinophagaceae bacterium]|nr:CpsB/CapC family capsule biosynthesis tyrosine phosphatase [Chitinophagaceae bacterium]